jgi:hypothetical protein
VVDTFTRLVAKMSTPVLATLASLLPTRREPGGIRMYWPKGSVAIGISQPDTRPALSPRAIERAAGAVDAELLRRFEAQPHFDTVFVDAALRDVVVPFNERTASASAVTLPRGSKVAVPDGKTLRMFLHWCEPQSKGRTTDLDLSVAFFDEAWAYAGVCSFYALKVAHAGHDVAVSSGDLRSAPPPKGATEFVDIDRAAARAAGLRWAVMVVNAYAGMSFGELERAFAGLMLRDEVRGEKFDPRTVQLKFQLTGEHGVFMPLVVDLHDDALHWLDTYSKGGFGYNTVETSKNSIGTICPEMIEYFGQGARMSMLQLSLRHAAARGRRVVVRDGDAVRTFVRRPDEASVDFLARLRGPQADAEGPVPADDTPWLALLHRGDVPVPPGSEIYALFPEQLVPTISASDLVVGAPD